MPNLALSDIADLVKGTLKELGPPKFSQIAQNLQRYEIYTKWFKKNKMVVGEGYAIQRNLMVRLTNGAAHVSLTTEDSTGIGDVMEQITVPFKYARTQYGFNYVETLANRGKSLVFNLLEPRRGDAMISLVEELESKAWSTPASTTSLEPYGIPYWVVKNATTGFNGGHPSGHSAIAGLDVANAPTFKNYTATYVNVTKQDLVKTMRTAARKTDFVSPVNLSEYRGSAGSNYRYYMNEATLSKFEELGEAQNENLGRDLAPMDGEMTFHKNPLVYVPQLDSDTSNPVYQIDHTTFFVCAQKGNWMRESDVIRDPRKKDWFYVPIDLGYNYLCIDRRRNAVFYIAS